MKILLTYKWLFVINHFNFKVSFTHEQSSISIIFKIKNLSVHFIPSAWQACINKLRLKLVSCNRTDYDVISG